MKKLVRPSVLVAFIACVIFGNSSFVFAQEKKPLKFFILTDLTGPVHAQIASEGWAAEDYFAWLNKQGGIEGHPVDISVIDTKYSLPLIRSAYNRIKDTKNMALNFDAISGGIEALKGEFIKDKIPAMMMTGHGPAVYPPGWVFSVMTPYDDVLCTMADWITSFWKENRKPRLALFLGDYASGRAPELAKWYCEKKGIEVVSVEYCPLQPTDSTDLLSRIRDAKPDYIFDTLMADQIKVVLRDRVRLGIKTPQVTFVFSSEVIMATVPKEAYVGYMGFQNNNSWWNADVPGVKLALDLYKKRGNQPNLTYFLSVGGCMVWEEAVRNALKKVGYDGLTGPAVYDGYMGIKQFTARGIFKDITYTKDDLRGNRWQRIAKINDDSTLSWVTDHMPTPWNLKMKAEMEKSK